MTLREAFDLAGRVAIVTGGGGGIGAATSLVLAEAGAHVVVVDRDKESAVRTAEDVVSAGGSAVAIDLDVTDSAALNDLVDEVVSRHRSLDVMVNNAGIITDSPPSTLPEEELDRVHAVNFKAVVFGSQAAARVMMPRRRGSIINVTSGSIDMPFKYAAAYTSAKAASHQFTRSLALEIASTGVRVNTVAPGWVDTPMTERSIRADDGTVDEVDHKELLERWAEVSPMGLTGEPLDQAYAILYLASNAARFVTGQVMRPNGGASMLW